MSEQERADTPSQGHRIEIEVKSVPKDGTALTVRFLGGWRSVLTHWYRGNSIPCRGKNCDGPTHRNRLVWKAYAPGEWYREQGRRAWVPAVFEVTERAATSLGAGDLRGQKWEFQRRTNDKGNKEVCAVFIDLVTVVRPASEINVVAAVERMYRCKELVWDAEMPFAPAQVLVAEIDDAWMPPSNEPARMTPEEQIEAYKRNGFKELARKLAERHGLAFSGNGNGKEGHHE